MALKALLEILLKELDDHGKIREDMPGGWGKKNGSRNAFMNSGLTSSESEALSFVREMAKIRESYSIVNTGSFRHWAPYDKIYAYCWYDEDEIILILANRSKKSEYFDINRLTELTFKDLEIILDTKSNIDPKESLKSLNAKKVPLLPDGLKILHFTR